MSKSYHRTLKGASTSALYRGFLNRLLFFTPRFLNFQSCGYPFSKYHRLKDSLPSAKSVKMAPKKKTNKKADDWEAELGETPEQASAPEEPNKAPEEANAEDEFPQGGLMAMMRKKQKKKKGKQENDFVEGESPATEEQNELGTKAPEEASIDDEFALPAKKGKGKPAPAKSTKEAEEVDDDDQDEKAADGHVMTKKEKEKAKKEREKQRKKENVSTFV